MSMERPSWISDTPQLLRYAALALAAIACGGLAVELAATRHWDTTIRLIPWFAVGVVVAAIALVAFWPSRGRVWLARILALVVLASAVFGIYEHVAANYHAGPLDLRYYQTWGTMSEAERWWAAISKSVGPSPPFAPGALAQAALLVALATIRHPALARQESAAAEAVPYSAAPHAGA
jgi:hypothetical protein